MGFASLPAWQIISVAHVPLNGSLKGMTTEFKFSGRQVPTDVVQRVH